MSNTQARAQPAASASHEKGRLPDHHHHSKQISSPQPAGAGQIKYNMARPDYQLEKGEFTMNAAKIVKAWADMSDNEKVTMIKKCVYKATQDEHFSPSTPRLFRQHDFDEFISETWLRVAAVLSDVDKLTARNEKRAAQGKKSLTLVSIVYNGARASIAAIAYADSKHAAASDFEVMNDNGECFSYIETGAADPTANTENAAIIRGAFEDMAGGLDPVDSRLWEFVQRGYTERKMAAMLTAEGLGMSNVAVHKKVVKLRARLQAVA